ncbi:NAD(P)-binding domain-containing protein [Trebonia sp.]|uniref:NAD(P)-binding domain-containing protein n=1 Tax=Trebonia sp. TaxID=2767075 RepID=UPI0026345C1D|nr:NAD(P)-binding domain-containing protein [Trebonia sp.]
MTTVTRRPGTCPLRIAFVGVGQTGTAMFRRLAHAGHDVVAIPHNQDHAHRLGAAGIPVLHVAPGTLVSSHTTGDPAVLRRTDEDLRRRGSQAVEGTLSGDAASIVQGRLTVILSGDHAAIARAEDVLGSYTDVTIRCGSLGHAQRLKLLNNLTFVANAQLALEALAAGTELGLDPSLITQALMASSGASRALGIIAEFPGTDAFVDQVGRYMVKDVAACPRVIDSLGIDLPHLSVAAANGPIATSATA